MNRGRIVLIDDDPRLVNILAMYLNVEGYEVATAQNGEQGLNEIDQQTPDLVILDVMMPGMDGFETCRRIRAAPRSAEVPVLMFTALSGEDDIEEARQAGANHMITKPFNLISLGEVVRTFFPDSSS